MNTREELHRLLDGMLDTGEKIGCISYKEKIDSPIITCYRLQLDKFQRSENDK